MLVYLFSPSNIVFNPLPPPITTIFGPCSYMFLLNISELMFTFFLPEILSSVASTNNSIVLLFKYINPKITLVKPNVKNIIIFAACFNVIALLEIIILAIP